MPSIQSRVVEILVRLLRWKRESNRMRQRVESGQTTYTEPTRRQRRKYHITQRDFRSHAVWTIATKQNSTRKQIIYLHGGGFVNSFAPQHWNFMCRLIDALGCTVIAPNYPHAPEYYVHDVFDFLLPLYDEVASTAGSANLTLMGDSSGGGIALALAQLFREKGRPQPAHVILLSPWLDASLSHPDVPRFNKIDPFLDMEGLKYAGALYARDVDLTHYLVSPVFGSLKHLAPVSLFVGTRDILFPDCRKLRDLATREGVKLNYHEYEAMLHDWMLISLPESKQVLKEIVAILGTK